MTAKYYAILTTLGAAKLANAMALGTKLEITTMAVGDGGGVLPTPDANQTAIVGEQRRAPINMLSIDPANPGQIIAEQVIPENEGGFWIRTIGLYDKDGTLIAVANCPETYKPQLQEGSGRTQTIRMILIVSNTDAITLKIDPAVVLATRKYVDDKVIEVKAYADELMAAHLASANPHNQYAPKASPALTGTPTAPTPVKTDNTTKLATTAHVKQVVADYAPLANPALTGKPTAPTAAQTSNDTQLATTAFVKAAITALIDSSPAAMDTLNELAAALGNDPNFATTMTNLLAAKAPLASPAMTGTPTAPTAAQTVNNTQIATTAFVKAALAALVDSSPAALDTLNELAAALGDDPNFAATMTTELAKKMDKARNGADIPDVAAFLNNLGLVGGLASDAVGRLIGVKIITASTTYAATPGTKKVLAIITGGGGAGGSCSATTTGSTFSGAGGGAGGTCIGLLNLADATNKAITIGAGGAAELAGGSTTFAGMVAGGGGGGGYTGVTSTPGGTGGTATGGIMNIPGGYGGDGQSGTYLISGMGGGSLWGTGGRSGQSTGMSSIVYGAGGGGAYDTGFSGTKRNGGNGAPGVAVILEFA